MYDYGYKDDALMNLRDSVSGVVRGQNKAGDLYIDILIERSDSNEGILTVPAFGYWSSRVDKGTGVICSIRKWAEGDKRMLVRVDAVNYVENAAA